ncbi:MAG: DUF4175 family protein [Bacteroidia bacterium]
MGDSYQILVTRLDEFIRKYYKNQLLRGLLYASTLGLSFYISLAVTAYYGSFSIPLRTILFYLFIGGSLFILSRYIILPLLKLYRIGDIISYEDAALIIGRHFGEVQDKLLNILQLKKQADSSSMALLEASIEQKIKDIRPVPFTIAINLAENKKYARYLIIPALAILSIWLIKPSLIGQGTKQLFHYNTHFAKVAPFQFVIENKNLNAIEQKDFTLNLKLTGNEVPDDIYIEYEGSKFKMDKLSPVSFQYTFRNVQHDVNFSFNAAEYESDEYKLNVFPDPVLVNFDVKLHYPPYTGKKDESLHNTGDMAIPQGTVVSWQFNTRNTDNIRIHFNDSARVLSPSGQDIYSVSRRFMQSDNYSIATVNKFLTNRDSVKYAIQVIPDLYPSIADEQKQDSLSAKHLYFNGMIKDDYGFSKLAFHYRIYSSEDSSAKAGITKMTDISIEKNTTQQPFYFYWDMDTLNFSPGTQVEYYFEVWDNDGVNGPKSTKSAVMYFKAPSLDQVQKNADENNSKIKNDLSKTIQQAYSLENQMEQMRADMYNKDELNWADKKKVKDLLNQQMDLEKKAEDLSRQNKQNNEKQWEFQKKDSDIAQKQEEIQKLFDQLASDSLKKKIADLQKMMDQMNKNQVQQELDKMAMNNQDLKKELQRTLDLFKQMEFQQQLTQNIQQLDSLSKKQEQLSELTKAKSAPNAELQKKQDALNKEMQDVAKSLDDLQKKNEQLEEPTGYKSPEQQMQNIQQQMQNSSQQLSQGKNGKASQSQKNAAQQMKQQSDELSKFQAQEQQSEDEADENSLRNILNNLLDLSFAQEDLMTKLTSSGSSTMQYADIAKKQKELQDNANSIADSLYKLSRKSPEISRLVNQEMDKINYNMKEAVSDLEQRQGFSAASRQQYSMTSVNNLALMLNDALQDMKAAGKKEGSPGSGSCNKPGGKGSKPSSKPSMAQMRQMQEQLSKQLDQMKNAMGKQKGGQKPGQGDEQMSEQLAKMAAQQQYIRQMMQQAEDEATQNKGAGELGNMADEMNKIEEDIVNKRITDATLQRQENLVKHLLDYEKAEKTQGQEPEFQSHVAKKQFFGNPNPFFQYNSQKNSQNELLKTVPPDLNPFYKEKVNDYFNSFQE